MKALQVFRRLLVSAVLLCACAPSYAGLGYCAPDAPSLVSTQTSAGGLFTIDIAVNAGGCPAGASAFDGALTTLVLPYFSDSHAAISAPTGWTWQIVSDDLLNVGHGAGTLIFSAVSTSSALVPHATLSGFLISSTFSSIQATAFQATTVGLLTTDYYFAAATFGYDLMPLIPGSPMAVAALEFPTTPVPEPSAWVLLALGLALVWAATNHGPNRRLDQTERAQTPA